MKKLKAKELRDSNPSQAELLKIKRNPIYFVLDEILDTYNIGSMFRLADAVAAEKIYLCGKMETPPSSRIHKAAIGTENWVPWAAAGSAQEAVRELKKNNIQIIAIEQNKKSIPYSQLSNNLRFPVALVLGHETKGVNKNVLKEADQIVELPMLGINNSFNVWGCAAVIAYKLLELQGLLDH
ncbi:MAG: tRNA/rRNA methyltransferase [Candidatus Woesebacteria bacterium GW2011_GWB1_43_14]|uniref:tRNA/rRNA methyltransferase n=1 Tax=Candidatus Woesebacteria bacterium GW2011_GWB1_43_14 TaxID=1618578 RepID=A0A0G1GJA0_9BACT|nr:MAG: tRNA/rRNA methyltransferase [Candidatus Woesebacteria bacterium GW2011_GWC1_42_9]KKS98848.1 MAG: tRNA/rRNA methyltransferase [Candidatus Woesebacteria bacterium GW2011_GWB1_43_14]